MIKRWRIKRFDDFVIVPTSELSEYTLEFRQPGYSGSHRENMPNVLL